LRLWRIGIGIAVYLSPPGGDKSVLFVYFKLKAAKTPFSSEGVLKNLLSNISLGQIASTVNLNIR